MMKNLPVIVFPHSSLPEEGIKRVLSFFGPLTIFRPWFLDRPPSALEGGDLGLIRVLRPPPDLKPKRDFKALLSASKGWMRAGPDKSIIAFLKARGGRTDREDTTWEIRGALRQRGETAKPSEEDDTLKWHLILHLAQEIEDERRDADRMLKALKEKGSPLKGAVEEGEYQGLFADLPQFDADQTLDVSLLLQVYEAWFSLFEGHLRGHDLLVTPDRHVMNHVTDLWQEYGDLDRGTLDREVAFRFPDLSHLRLEELLEIRGRLDKKTGELKQTILDLRKDPAGQLARLDALSSEVENESPWDLSSGTLKLLLRYFAPYSVTKRGGKERILKHLFGKAMILVETEEAHHERNAIKD